MLNTDSSRAKEEKDERVKKAMTNIYVDMKVKKAIEDGIEKTEDGIMLEGDIHAGTTDNFYIF